MIVSSSFLISFSSSSAFSLTCALYSRRQFKNRTV